MGREEKRWSRSSNSSQNGAGKSKHAVDAEMSAASVPGCAPKEPLLCPVMEPGLVDAITVPLIDIEERLLDVLGRYGAAIVTNVLEPEECERFEGLFAADVSELIDPEALRNAHKEIQSEAKRVANNIRDLPLASQKLLGQMDRCQLRGLPHGRFAWAGRLHPGVRRAYEVIHGRADLVSSCDNSFFAPQSHAEQYKNRNWPHVDHNKHDCFIYDDDGTPLSDWDVYQGLLYVWGSDSPQSSTTVLWCGSHTDIYEEIMADRKMQKRGTKGQHFSRIIEDLDSEELRTRLCSSWRSEARRAVVPAGSLLLWSSKTLHQGWSGGPRLAQPVCWEPAGRRSEFAHERKMRLAALGLPSTHWASLGVPHSLVNIQPSAPTCAQDTGRDGLALPLKSTMRPVTLAPGVQIEDMWKHFRAPDWEKPLRPDLKDMLIQSIDPDIRSVL